SSLPLLYVCGKIPLRQSASKKRLSGLRTLAATARRIGAQILEPRVMNHAVRGEFTRANRGAEVWREVVLGLGEAQSPGRTGGPDVHTLVRRHILRSVGGHGAS